MHPDGLLRAKACAVTGLCAFCETPLRGLQKVICGSRECARAYDAAFHRDRRFSRPTARTLWFCGCGKRLDCGRHMARGCLFAVDRWPIVIVPARRAA